jgi:hypothetical protein
MKRINIFRLGLALTSFVVLAMVVFAPAMLPWIFGGGAIYSITTGTMITGDAVETTNVQDTPPSSTFLMSEVSQKITEMKPARTPLDTIMRSAVTKKKIESFKTEFYAVDVRPFTDTVATTYTKPGVAQQAGPPIVEGTGGVELANVIVTNIDIWSQDDTAMAVGISGSDDLNLVLFVADVDVTNSIIKVQALNGLAEGSLIVVPTIASTTVLVRMGNAKAEKDAQTSPYAMIPEKEYNYCQIFMAQVEESTYQAMHKKEVQWGFDDYTALNIYDMKTTIELTSLFGYRRQFTDKLGRDEKYTCGGLTRNISNTLEYGSGSTDRMVTNDTLIGWSKDIFTGNSGSDTRILFAGPALTQYISQIDFQKQLGGNQTEARWGIEWKVISTNFGKLLWKMHPLFSLIGWDDYGVVLDINNIEKHEFLPMTTREVDLKGSGQKNVQAKVLEETSCPILRYDDTHRLISPKA